MPRNRKRHKPVLPTITPGTTCGQLQNSILNMALRIPGSPLRLTCTGINLNHPPSTGLPVSIVTHDLIVEHVLLVGLCIMRISIVLPV